MCQKTSFKQVMTMADKGHVTYLVDLGKSFEEVSEITGYNPDRLLFLVEGLRGTEARLVALEAFYELREEGFYDTPKNNSGSKVRSRPRRTKEVSVRTPANSVPRTYVRRSKDPLRSRFGSSKGNHTVGSGSVVTTFRNHKDYRGD